MKTKVKAVVFDAGGVLVDWETICRKFAAEAGINEVKFFKVFLDLSFDSKTGSDLGFMSADEFFEKCATALNVSSKAKDWRKRFVPGFKRIEPTYKLLDELKGKFKLALLTNSKVGLWDDWESVGKFKEYFKIIIDSTKVHILKPDPRIFQVLLDRLQLKPQECLFVDDGIKNIEAAEKLGFKTVHFTDIIESIKEIKKVLYG